MNSVKGKGWIIKAGQIVKHSDIEFIAYYKGHYIQINEEDEYDDYCEKSKFYIQVSVVDGPFCYDGWWGAYDKTLYDAIEEALKGSLLLNDNQISG